MLIVYIDDTRLLKVVKEIFDVVMVSQLYRVINRHPDNRLSMAAMNPKRRFGG